MTKFIYIADTHCGADPMGYQQQQAYPNRFKEIISTLFSKLKRESIDFILHGGDMIDFTSEDNIIGASKAFDIDIPVYLCLGNHDLTSTDALSDWLNIAPQFFINKSPNFTIETEDCLIHVVPNQWCEKSFYWQREQSPHFLQEQKEFLSKNLQSRTDIPHIILTHSPVFGLPIEQTGMPAPFHAPPESFTSEITDFTEKYKNIKCVLGAHNHMNMRMCHNKAEFVTVSSLVETPFEFKIFEITKQKIKMSTVPLQAEINFATKYDNNKSYVQGQKQDREFSMVIN